MAKKRPTHSVDPQRIELAMTPDLSDNLFTQQINENDVCQNQRDKTKPPFLVSGLVVKANVIARQMI